MKRLLWILTLVGACALLAAPGRTSAQATDPAAVVRAALDVYNAGDIEATLAYYADDAVVRFVGGPPGQPALLTGKDQIRASLLAQFAAHGHVTIENLQVSGDTVSIRAANSSDLLRQRGIASVDGTSVFIVQNGKIRSDTITLTPPGAGQGPPAAGAGAPGMPATGADQSGLALTLLLLGLLAVAAGAVFRRAQTGTA